MDTSSDEFELTYNFLEYTPLEWAQKLNQVLVDLDDRGCQPFQLKWDGVPPKVVENCRFLHYATTFLMMSSDRREISLLFNAQSSRDLSSAGNGFEIFRQEVKRYDYSEKCNSVWHTDSIAYRCFTCARNPCMSLCSDCFDAADHSDHDYSRFFSQSGGACDCGNSDILDPNGFCKHHQQDVQRVEAPKSLMLFPEFIMTKVLLRLVSTFRQFGFLYRSAIENRTKGSNKCIAEQVSKNIMTAADEFLEFLQEMIELGRPTIDVLSKIICDEKLYAGMLPDSKPLDDRDVKVAEAEMIFNKHGLLLADIDSMKASPTPTYLSIDFSELNIDCKCLLDELIFYMVRLGFPQTLINVLLTLLPNNEMKERFSCRFFEWYGLIDGLMYDVMNDGFAEDNFEPSKIASRVIHASVQICSSKNVCIYLQRKVKILQRVLDSALKVIYTSSMAIAAHHDIEYCYARNPVRTTDPDSWQVFNLNGNRFFSRFGHWYLTTDLQNLFAHIELCRDVFSDEDLTRRYLALLSAIQGANVLWRIVDGDHIETDSSHLMQRYFTVEWEVNAMLLFSSVGRMTEQDLPELRRFGTLLQEQLQKWFDAIGLTQNHIRVPPFYCTSHLPLHRQLSATVLQYMKLTKEYDVMDTLGEEFLACLFINPLKLQVMVAEYFAKMWVRNGNMIRNNVYLYCQTALTNGFKDLDLSLMRLVCSKLDGWKVMELMFDVFHVHDCLTFPPGISTIKSPERNVVITQRDWIFPMIDGFLKLFLEILLIKSYVEMDLEDEVKAEVVHILSTSQQPYSKLRQNLPDRGSDFNELVNVCFEKVVKSVARFEQPDQGNQIQQGMYILTDDAWYNDVDMVRARFRASSPREFNALIMRMELVLREKLNNTHDARFVWPTFPIPEFGPTMIDTHHLLLHPAPLWVCRFVVDVYLVYPRSVTMYVLQQSIYILTLMVVYAVKCTTPEAFRYLGSCLDYHSDVFLQCGQSSAEGLTVESGLALFFSLFNENGVPFAITSAGSATDRECLTSQLLNLYRTLHGQEFQEADPAQRDRELLKLCMKNVETRKILGSGTEYVARLLCYLYNYDSLSRMILEEKLRAADSLASSPMVSSSLEKKNDFLTKKMAARKRQMEIMKSKKAQNETRMAKLMKEEGMKEDDIKESSSQRFDCPICNGSQGVEDVFGLFAYIQTTSVSNGMVHKDNVMLDPENGLAQGKFDRYCIWEKSASAVYGDSYPGNTITHISTGELKACGHYSHMKCFERYKASVHENGITVKHRLSVPCPVCRSNVTGLIPLDVNFIADPAVMEEKVVLDDSKMAEDGAVFFRRGQTLINQWSLLTRNCENQREMANAYDNYKMFLLKLSQLNQQLESTNSVNGKRLSHLAEITNALEKNPMNVSLSLLKNQLDRISLVTSLGYSYPTRLRNLMTNSLFKLSLCCLESTEENMDMLKSIWDKLDGQSTKGVPILFYDSTNLMLLMVSVISVLPNIDVEEMKAFYRRCYCLCLVHNRCRSTLLYYLRTPRTQHGSVNPTTDVLLATIRRCDEAIRFFDTNLTKQHIKFGDLATVTDETAKNFATFSLNLMIEAGLLSPVADAACHDCTSVEDLSKVILGQVVPQEDMMQLVGSRMERWLEDVGTALRSEDGIRDIFVTEAWWKRRELKEPPLNFDSLFNVYFKFKCAKCEDAPAQPFICMACGMTVCFDDCCDVTVEGIANQISEVEQHTHSCTAGVGCFLSLTSTMIVIIHGGLCNFWGSIYLDDHGEEDRNLRRGKKLTLSTTRLRRLTELWVTHDFDRSLGNRSWFPVEHLPHILKECHLYPG
ncbi:unnamed protein product [Bursaphelenchus okinawaensis]|uniref:E3 ubiquitin-protein ligase n=1 Tax=Bursaphelenchus okinawaensis TaxID=465554 RepID=A0A811K845_9BILA|nr:unnamed protein product [Bursaphelenchus okinawaensis]CAG9093610.1 unnamed protein product [Bursaphelenchus okinawaensis]